MGPVCLLTVMPGLVPAIHVVRRPQLDVDARDEPGHDGVTIAAARAASMSWPIAGAGHRRAA
ncbi:protein of unknown function [Bradyrhizobium sp. ORS 285]|nr:hypothetical protein BRAO285_950014 [Bradyrhizobium sp. ORS 285]SMX60607.1 protein of unknown function [Bradyrhizobium sp. ORS 285]